MKNDMTGGKGSISVAQTFSGKGYSAALGLFVAVLALYAAFQSPLFQLQRIDVVGGERLTDREVLTWTGLSLGQNLFDLDTTAIEQALLDHPLVASASVSRRLPATLRVVVDERQPVAYLSAGGSVWAIDGEAIALFESPTVTLPLPLITLDDQVEPQPGAPVEHPRLHLALAFARGLSLKGLANLSEVHVTGEGIVAYTRDGISISLGSDGEMGEKARVLEGLLDQIQARRLAVAHIDLRHPKSPVFRDKR